MSYSAVFKRGGKQSEIKSLSYSLSKMLDDKGRPSSRVPSATFTITIASDDKHKGDMVLWLATDSVSVKGDDVEIVIFTDDYVAGQVFKKIKLENTHIVSYFEDFQDGMSISETFSISAEKVTIDDTAKFDFKWPKA